MYKSYIVRIYPNIAQQTLIQKTFGCVRFVYNQCLEYKDLIYNTQGKNISKFELINYKNQILKNTYPWLQDVDKHSLDGAIDDLEMAYNLFFKKVTNHPKFKSKKNNRKTYTTKNGNNDTSITVDYDKRKIKIPKIKWIKARGLRTINGRIKKATIIQNPDGRYYISILIEDNNNYFLLQNNNKIGIDLGIKDFAITSNGKKISAYNYSKKSIKNLKKAQRRLSRKQKGSKNRQKERKRVAKKIKRMINQKKDYYHKLSSRLIYENQVICLEDLDILSLLKKSEASKYIYKVSWGVFIQQLKYKGEWYGRQIVQVDQYFPSSQICCKCGYQNKKIKDISIRSWKCPNCGIWHDRDINAAKNILNQGLKIIG